MSIQGDVASAQLTQTLNAQAAHSVTLDLLVMEVNLAKLNLRALQAWTNPLLDPASAEDVAQARILLRQSELVAEQLALQIEGAELRAPLDGIVSAVHLRPGEWAARGVPAVAVIDTSRWTVETRNVGELVIGQVSVGQPVSVQVYAFQGQRLRGHVGMISPLQVVQQGDTTYTLTIALEPTDLALRPGMNAQVEITTD
jgi:HlyD family secretion protein